MDKILVVDDEKSVRMVLGNLLKNEGYEVIEAENGKEALELVQKENPHVILMDIRMPVMGGLDAVKTLKGDEKTKRIPILVITAAGESKAEAAKADVDDFLQKPFDAEEVSIRVKSMLKIRNLSDELQRVITYMDELEKEREKT